MNNVTNVYYKVDNLLQKVFDSTISRTGIVSAIVQMLILLYISNLSPDVPKSIAVVFKNVYFRILVYVIILITSRVSPIVAILISVAFTMTMNYVNNKAIWEFLDDTNQSSAITGTYIAPSKDMAISAADAVMSNLSPPLVTSQMNGAPIVVQPSVSSNGTLSIPTIVVSPAPVKDINGNVIMVKPDVVIMGMPGSEPTLDGTASCLPNRKVDMSKVKGADSLSRW